MSKKLIQENMIRIEQIVQSSYSYRQKKEEMKYIHANFIERYCNEKKEFVEFSKSKIVKTFTSIRNRMTKNELISFALDNLVFHIEESPTYIDLLDTCLSKNIEENECLNQYCIKDLRELVNRSHNKKTQFITGKSLFLDDISYLYNSPINDNNLRNLCIHKKLLPREEFGKRPRSSKYYESLLNYIPIEKDMKIFMQIWAIYNGGYEYDEEYSYFDFLGVKPFPINIKEFDYMQKEGLVDNYNRVAKYCCKEVISNILDIVNTIDNYEYPFFLETRIRVIFLKNKFPDFLEEIEPIGKFSNSTLIKLKVNQILGI